MPPTPHHEPELLAAKAVALGRIGDLKAAIAFSDASIEERGDTPYIWLARGDVLLARKEKRASFCFEKALSLASHNWFFRWLASRIYFYHQKFSLALKSIQQALEFDQAQSVVWLQLGYCQNALGLPALAADSFEQARELNPNCVDATKAMRELEAPGLWDVMRGWWHRLVH